MDNSPDPWVDPHAELIKPPQSRRGKGWSVVYRKPGNEYGLGSDVYIKRQSGYYTRTWWRAFRQTPRLACEHRALVFCHRHNIPAPRILSFDEKPDITELILEDVGPVQEFDIFIRNCTSDERRQQVIEDSACIMARLHSYGWVHGALGNDHLLVREDGNVVLIDFEKAHWNPFRVKRDLDRFWRRTTSLDAEMKTLLNHAYWQVRKTSPPSLPP